jgi:small subunit ribosomal protein S3
VEAGGHTFSDLLAAELETNILAEYIAFQLKNRVSFRKAMKKAIELTKKSSLLDLLSPILG